MVLPLQSPGDLRRHNGITEDNIQEGLRWFWRQQYDRNQIAHHPSERIPREEWARPGKWSQEMGPG